MQPVFFRFPRTNLGRIFHCLYFSWINDSSIRCIQTHHDYKHEESYILEFRTENPVSSEPFISRAKARQAKKSEKGYGEENCFRRVYKRVWPGHWKLSCKSYFRTIF